MSGNVMNKSQLTFLAMQLTREELILALEIIKMIGSVKAFSACWCKTGFKRIPINYIDPKVLNKLIDKDLIEYTASKRNKCVLIRISSKYPIGQVIND